MLVVRGDKHHMTDHLPDEQLRDPSRLASGCRETTRRDDVRRVTVTLAHHRRPRRRSAPATVVRVAPPADGAASLRPRRRSPWGWSRVGPDAAGTRIVNCTIPSRSEHSSDAAPPYSPARRSRTGRLSVVRTTCSIVETQHRHNLIIDPAYPELIDAGGSPDGCLTARCTRGRNNIG